MELSEKIIEQIKAGAVGVLPTDTIYGLVCCANNQAAVKRLLSLKHRDNNHPPVIVIGSLSDLDKLKIKLSSAQELIVSQLWPGPFSLVLPCTDTNLDYLHGGRQTLAIRLPNAKWLTDIIKRTGPLATSSANIHKQDAATTIKQAKSYFGDRVDFYVDAGGELPNHPSTIISLEGDKLKLLRQGVGKIPEELKSKIII
jgi:tRNA threonylcarbamoyl adenosine modification protein (Sua5/YciO/YrdC/YwlC family)